MAENVQTGKDADAAKELLMADYAYLRESFWKNEEAGERRVQLFVTLVTAVLVALVAIAGDKGLQDSAAKLALGLCALASLLVLGMVTFFRIIRRNEVTDGYKKDMDAIRQRIKNSFDEQHALVGHMPMRTPGERTLSPRKFGGLSYTVAAMNSILLSAFTGVVAAVRPVNRLGLGAEATVMVACFAITLIAQALYIQGRDLKNKAKLSESMHTHAGGVVVRFDAKGEPQFLLVRSTNDTSWVLPKGHIKERERPVAAAVREVKEEAGIKTVVIDMIGASRYQLDQDAISVQFFLMIYSRPSGRPSEKRAQEWFAYDEALQRLDFDNAKYILKKANPRVSAFIRM